MGPSVGHDDDLYRRCWGKKIIWSFKAHLYLLLLQIWGPVHVHCLKEIEIRLILA